MNNDRYELRLKSNDFVIGSRASIREVIRYEEKLENSRLESWMSSFMLSEEEIPLDKIYIFYIFDTKTNTILD